MSNKTRHHLAMNVKIAELKNHLSAYLRRVRRGESILVLDRDRVIARLEPATDARGLGDADAELARLENEGVLRRGKKRLPARWLDERLRVRADVVGALL